MKPLVFHRHTKVKTPYLELVEPVRPSKVQRKKLKSLGFEVYEEDGLWWNTLAALGRANMSRASLEALFVEHGLEAEVREAPTPEPAEDEPAEVHESDEDEIDLSTAVLHLFKWNSEIGAHVDRADDRAYALSRQIETLEAQVATLRNLVGRLSADSGPPGRSIFVTDPGSIHEVEGRQVYFDLVRGVPVIAGPEERVRQCVLRHLVENLDIPLHLMESEFRLPRMKDRADIVVRVPASSKADVRFLAIIECKAPGTPLNDDVRDQAKRYADALQASYFGITDGGALYTWHRQEPAAGWQQAVCFPNLRMLLGDVPPVALVSPSRSVARPPYDELVDAYHVARLGDEAAVLPYDDTHPKFLMNFASLFFDTSEGPAGLVSEGWRCTLDRHLITTSFGNAGYQPDAYSGPYRGLVVASRGHGSVLAFFRTWTTRSTASANPTTMLALGLHHADGRRHHAVQLNLPKAIEDHGDRVSIIHRGRVSKGGGGSFRAEEVVQHVSIVAPDMIRDGKIYLGELPNDRLISWNDAFPVLVRVLRFGLAVDTLRTGAEAVN